MIMKTSRNGFTLLELLVTVTIIAVLTVIGVVSYSSVNKRSRDVKRKSDLEQIRSALEMYRADNAEYPSKGSGSWTVAHGTTQAPGLEDDLVPAYAPTIPNDPNQDDAYRYIGIQTNNVYSSYCVCAWLETIGDGTPESTCTTSLPSQACNYGLKNP
jgi:general secretion pathway protein G